MTEPKSKGLGKGDITDFSKLEGEAELCISQKSNASRKSKLDDRKLVVGLPQGIWAVQCFPCGREKA